MSPIRILCSRSSAGSRGPASGSRVIVIVYAVVDDALSPVFPLGVELETFIRREDAERFIEEVREGDPELAAKLRIEERELEAGGLATSWMRYASCVARSG